MLTVYLDSGKVSSLSAVLLLLMCAIKINTFAVQSSEIDIMK